MDCKYLTVDYTIDVIGQQALGNNQDSFNDEDLLKNLGAERINDGYLDLTSYAEKDVISVDGETLIQEKDEKRYERATKSEETYTKSSNTYRASRSGNEVTYEDEESLIQKKAKKRAKRAAEIEESDTDSSNTYALARSRKTSIFNMILGKVSRNRMHKNLLLNLLTNEQLIKDLLYQKLLKKALKSMSKRTEQEIKNIMATSLIEGPQDLLTNPTGPRS